MRKKKKLPSQGVKDLQKAIKRKDFRKIQHNSGVKLSGLFDKFRLEELGKELFFLKWRLQDAGRKLTEGEELAVLEIDCVIETIELILSPKTDYGYFNVRDVDMDLWLDSYCKAWRNSERKD